MNTAATGHFGRFNGNEPAPLAAIRQAETQLKLHLPAGYRAFLASMNGGEGFIGSGYAILWRAEELEAKNAAYHTPTIAPDLVLFGSDGGGEAFAFNKSDGFAIVRVPFIGMEPALPIASTFDSFLAWLAGR